MLAIDNSNSNGVACPVKFLGGPYHNETSIVNLVTTNPTVQIATKLGNKISRISTYVILDSLVDLGPRYTLLYCPNEADSNGKS